MMLFVFCIVIDLLQEMCKRMYFFVFNEMKHWGNFLSLRLLLFNKIFDIFHIRQITKRRADTFSVGAASQCY